RKQSDFEEEPSAVPLGNRRLAVFLGFGLLITVEYFAGSKHREDLGETATAVSFTEDTFGSLPQVGTSPLVVVCILGRLFLSRLDVGR
ncbi:hypothetical protein CEXT_64851, partial [Caerostris extrusa]